MLDVNQLAAGEKFMALGAARADVLKLTLVASMKPVLAGVAV